MRLLSYVMFLVALLGIFSCGALIPDVHSVAGLCYKSFETAVTPPKSTHRTVIKLNSSCMSGSGTLFIYADKGPMLKRMSLDTLEERSTIFESDWYNHPMKIVYEAYDTTARDQTMSLKVKFYH